MSRREQMSIGELTVGTDGDAVSLLASFTASVTPVAAATIKAEEQDLTIPGVKVGDIVVAFKAPTAFYALNVGVGGMRVSAADTVSVKFVNPTAGSVTPSAGDWTFTVLRPAA